jgi:hypothetical protein
MHARAHLTKHEPPYGSSYGMDASTPYREIGICITLSVNKSDTETFVCNLFAAK